MGTRPVVNLAVSYALRALSSCALLEGKAAPVIGGAALACARRVSSAGRRIRLAASHGPKGDGPLCSERRTRPGAYVHIFRAAKSAYWHAHPQFLFGRCHRASLHAIHTLNGRPALDPAKRHVDDDSRCAPVDVDGCWPSMLALSLADAFCKGLRSPSETKVRGQK